MVVDSSAVAALILEEPGADEVEYLIDGGVMSAVNLAETVSLFARRGIPAERIAELLDPLDLTVVPLDRARAHATGILAPLAASAGLSLGDRACLALARELGTPALTADRAWLQVAKALKVKVHLFR